MAEKRRSALDVLKLVLKPFQTVGRAITRFLNLILVFLVYFLVIGPLSVIIRLTREKLLEATPLSDETYWVGRQEPVVSLDKFRRQF